MKDYLVEHALNTYWCGDRQDDIYVKEPHRVTTFVGAKSTFQLLGIDTRLPDDKTVWHLFSVGQLDPFFLNLVRLMPNWAYQKWMNVSDSMNKTNVDVTIYNSFGVNIPRGKCWFIFLNEKSLFFAIPDIPGQLVDVGKEDIFLRFYRNIFFGRETVGNNYLETRTYSPKNVEDILQFEQELLLLKHRGGYTRFYVNGLYTTNLNLGNVAVGDTVEYVYDGSVKKILKWKMSELYNFSSILDNVRKYLLHYPGINFKEVEYQDDIEVHIVIDRPGQHRRGVYFNKNQLKNMRMVTFKDYSIDSNMAMGLRDKLSEYLGLKTIPVEHTYVELIIRNGGDRRTLQFDANRVFELYKLDDDHVYRALIGKDSLVPEWYCANLEASKAIEMMGKRWYEMDTELVQAGMGYNAISKVLGDTPQKLSDRGNSFMVTLPPELQLGCTVYEFDTNGLMLGWHVHTFGQYYAARDLNARLIEAIVGVGDYTSDIIYGKDNLPIPSSEWSHRVYRCDLRNGVPDEQWVDITDSGDYEVKDEKLKWLKGVGSHWLAIRSDTKFIAYDTEVMHDQGLLNFTVMENPTGNPMDEMEPMQIPFAQLDIWMNRVKLIRGLDYFVKWPQVFITNKTYLNSDPMTTPQKFHVRASRLPLSNMELDKIEDYGWVVHGALSHNKLFDLRDDRVLQIVVGGMMFHRDSLMFSEADPGESLFHKYNGFPYQVKDLIVPFRGFTMKDAYELRKISQETDTRVSEYMTEYFKDTHPSGPSAIGPRYPVVSPFASHILYLLEQRKLVLPKDRLLSDLEVKDLCEAHEWLLDYDPMKEPHNPDVRFAFTIPHASRNVITLGYHEFHFFSRVVELYAYPGFVYKEYVAIKEY